MDIKGIWNRCSSQYEGIGDTWDGSLVRYIEDAWDDESSSRIFIRNIIVIVNVYKVLQLTCLFFDFARRGNSEAREKMSRLAHWVTYSIIVIFFYGFMVIVKVFYGVHV